MSTNGASPVLSIRVNTDGLDRAMERLRQLQDQMGQMSGSSSFAAFGSIFGGGGTDQSRNTWSEQRQAARMQAQHQREMLAMQQQGQRDLIQLQHQQTLQLREMDKHAQNMAKAWQTMEKVAKRVGATFKEFGGGLMGFGSMFGLIPMAAGAANLRRTAMGLGTTSGELQAFQTDFQRLVDPDAYLGWINQQEQTYDQRAAYTLLGHKFSGNTENDAIALLNATFQKLKGMPLQNLSNFNKIYGTNYSPEELRRLWGMSYKEFAEIQRENAADRKAMNIPDKDLHAWQLFSRQMMAASVQIKSTFIEGLAPLAEPLTELSAGFTQLARSFLSSHLVQEGIKKLADLFKNWAVEINTPQFHKDLKSIFDRIEKLAEAIGPAVDRIVADLPSLATVLDDIAHPIDTVAGAIGGPAADPRTLTSQRVGLIDKSIAAEVAKHKDFPQLGYFLNYAANHESDYGRNLKAFPTDLMTPGGIGAFGNNIGTTRALGFDPRRREDIPYSADITTALFTQLFKKYHDIQKTLAAFTVGPGLIDADIAKFGKDWKQHLLDPEFNTGRYAGGTQGLGKGYQAARYINPTAVDININVNNNTGGNTHVTATAMAY